MVDILCYWCAVTLCFDFLFSYVFCILIAVGDPPNVIIVSNKAISDAVSTVLAICMGVRACVRMCGNIVGISYAYAGVQLRSIHAYMQ